jgi:hypothetical protein
MTTTRREFLGAGAATALGHSYTSFQTRQFSVLAISAFRAFDPIHADLSGSSMLAI